MGPTGVSPVRILEVVAGTKEAGCGLDVTMDGMKGSVYPPPQI